MLLIFNVNIVLLLCLTRPALAQSTASLSISLVTPSAYVVGFTTQGTTVQTNELDAFVGLSLPAGTQEVYVVGVMQPNGAQAAYCVDCTIVNEKLVGDFKPFDTSSTDGSTQQVPPSLDRSPWTRMPHTI
ncbi:hypothetical protein PENSPDRAFT_278874 [Peniophora sp. CONT]|nr:hypothetical protein PENSPDRAFT_278874 [Peniophora sp. CONT]